VGKTSVRVVNEAGKLMFQTPFFFSELGSSSLQNMKFWGTKMRDLTTKPNNVVFQCTSRLPSPTSVGRQLFPNPLSTLLFLYLSGLDKKQKNGQFFTRTDRNPNTHLYPYSSFLTYDRYFDQGWSLSRTFVHVYICRV